MNAWQEIALLLKLDALQSRIKWFLSKISCWWWYWLTLTVSSSDNIGDTSYESYLFRHSNTARNWYGGCKGNLQGKMRVLKYHLYIQNKHYRKYNEIKTKNEKKEILLYIDFAESYQIRRKMKFKVLTLARTISVLLQLALTYASLS